MRRPLSALLSICVIGAAASCSDALTSPAGVALITTDSSSYTAVSIEGSELQVRVVTTFTNPSSVPDTLARCYPDTPYPIYGVELVSPQSSDGAGYDPTWGCVGHNHQIVVAAHSTRTDTLRLLGPNEYDSSKERFVGVLAGKFRISYGGQKSNVFEIKLPPGGFLPAVPLDLTRPFVILNTVVHLQSTGGVYVAPPITATLHNGRSDTLFIRNCNGDVVKFLERQDGDAWKPFLGSINPTCLSSPIAVPPGGSWTTTAYVSGAINNPSYALNFPVKTVDELPGVYRFVWSNIFTSRAAVNGSGSTTLPESERRSNAFAILVDR